ncbi:CAP domain-containing protein [Rummeliibacillus pycnus]|uniref:CAP domain-containing protein n=1 Tax=Rummeliibacillus pycnus TaxID=101070 RepID=UPI0037CAA08B
MKKLIKDLLITAIVIGGCVYGFKHIDHTQLTEKIVTVEKEIKKETLQKIENLQVKEEASKEQQKEIKVDNLGIPKITSAPKMTVASEYNKDWYVYENHFKNFTLTFSDKSGGYVAGNGRTIFDATIGKTTYNEIKQKLGTPLSQIEKGNVIYQLSSSKDKEQLLYNIDGYYVTFFIDNHNHNKLRSVQYIKKDVEMQKNGYYGQGTAKLKVGYEKLMVELINESRVEFGLKPLTYDHGLTAQARNHSQDMIDHHYFSHSGSDGSQPQSRMKAAGYNEHLYAENIASGQFSSIYAHEALMNSLGHRENILNPELTHVGVGVAFDTKNVPYYTINFYTPF